MTASQHMIQANGLRFRAMVDGPAAGEMFILLHGFPEGAESWSKQLEALAGAGFLAVATDLRGYGLSDAPEGVESYAIDHLVEDVRSIITAFGRPAAHVAGHDWGAMVAWFFAGRHPEMTKTLTVLSVPHPTAFAAASRDDEDQQTRSRYIALFLKPDKAEHVLSEDGYRRLRHMFTIGPNPDAVPPSIVDHFIRSLNRPGRLTAALNYYRANLSAAGGAWESRAEIGPITVPTVLLWGDEDPAVGRSAAEATAKHVDGEYRLEVLKGCGHWLQFESTGAVSRALTAAAASQ
jgi:pimeloyl-ACP methyl ester carboxylesterase